MIVYADSDSFTMFGLLGVVMEVFAALKCCWMNVVNDQHVCSPDAPLPVQRHTI